MIFLRTYYNSSTNVIVCNDFHTLCMMFGQTFRNITICRFSMCLSFLCEYLFYFNITWQNEKTLQRFRFLKIQTYGLYSVPEYISYFKVERDNTPGCPPLSWVFWDPAEIKKKKKNEKCVIWNNLLNHKKYLIL